MRDSGRGTIIEGVTAHVPKRGPAVGWRAMQTRARQESIIEAVRQGLEGDAAVEFVCRSGYAINTAAIARHLRAMGGRGHILELIRNRKTNSEILHLCLGDAPVEEAAPASPKQEDLFPQPHVSDSTPLPDGRPLYETTKVSLRLPSDLFEAIRLAARAEGKSQNQLVVDVLTSALSRMPVRSPDERRDPPVAD